MSMARWYHRFGKLHARLVAQLTRRTPSETAFLLLLPVVGLVIGLASAVIARFIDYLQRQFWGGGESLSDAVAGNPWPLLIVIPVIGGLIVGIIGKMFKVETRGGGTAGMIQAIAL